MIAAPMIRETFDPMSDQQERTRSAVSFLCRGWVSELAARSGGFDPERLDVPALVVHGFLADDL